MNGNAPFGADKAWMALLWRALVQKRLLRPLLSSLE